MKAICFKYINDVMSYLEEFLNEGNVFVEIDNREAKFIWEINDSLCYLKVDLIDFCIDNTKTNVFAKEMAENFKLKYFKTFI